MSPLVGIAGSVTAVVVMLLVAWVLWRFGAIRVVAAINDQTRRLANRLAYGAPPKPVPPPATSDAAEIARLHEALSSHPGCTHPPGQRESVEAVVRIGGSPEVVGWACGVCFEACDAPPPVATPATPRRAARPMAHTVVPIADPDGGDLLGGYCVPCGQGYDAHEINAVWSHPQVAPVVAWHKVDRYCSSDSGGAER